MTAKKFWSKGEIARNDPCACLLREECETSDVATVTGLAPTRGSLRLLRLLCLLRLLLQFPPCFPFCVDYAMNLELQTSKSCQDETL